MFVGRWRQEGRGKIELCAAPVEKRCADYVEGEGLRLESLLLVNLVNVNLRFKQLKNKRYKAYNCLKDHLRMAIYTESLILAQNERWRRG